MATTYSKGTEYGGANDFRILMGGHIRWSFPITDSDSNTWLEGNVLELAAAGTVQIDSETADGCLKGLAIEKRKTAGDAHTDLTVGSGMASVVLDEAIVETLEFTSGIDIAVNDKLYADGAGHITNVQAATEAVVGRALAAHAHTATTTVLRMFWSLQL